MALKSFLIKVGAVIAPLVLMVGLGGAQTVQAAGRNIVVANTLTPNNCGKFHTADTTQLTLALSAATKGKVLICPGTYFLNGDVEIDNARGLSIAAAVKGSRPTIVVDPATPIGLSIKDSTGVKLTDLILNSQTTDPGYQAISWDHSTGKISNLTLLGSANTDVGIFIQNLHDIHSKSLSITRTQVLGYVVAGLTETGPLRVSVSMSTFDATNNGTVVSTTARGVSYEGSGSDQFATGSLTKSTIKNNDIGVFISETSKVNINKNTFTGNTTGVEIFSEEVAHVTSKNRVSANTISGVPAGGFGVLVMSLNDPADQPMLKNAITKNVIHSALGGLGVGIEFNAPNPAMTTMTGTVTGNVLTGFANGSAIVNVNSWAGVTIKGNAVH